MIDSYALAAGDYTIEAATYGSRRTGSYGVGVTVHLDGLDDAIEPVGDPATLVPLSDSFTVVPPDASCASTLGTVTEGAGGARTLGVTMGSGAVERVTVTCTAEGHPSGAATVLCISSTANQGSPLSRAQYRVTPGTLNGVLASAEAVLAARSDRDTCGLSVNKLAAFMLSIGYHEIGSGTAGSAAPSPMTVGRWDTYALQLRAGFHNRYNYLNDAAGYEDSGVWDEPRRAYFHPGVGWWQLDDAGGAWRTLNHGQRADTSTGPRDEDGDIDDDDTGAEVIAAKLAAEFCDEGLNSLKTYMSNTWFACRPSLCFTMHERILLTHTGGSDDLHVTIAHNAGEYSTDGGVSAHRCRWHDAWTPVFDCFVYDTERPEGNAADSHKWGYDTDRSPLAAPFVAFTYDEKRMAVFPGPVMTALKPAGHTTTGSFATWIKAVPEGADVRDEEKAGPGLWSSGDYDRLGTPANEIDDSVLQIEICDDSGWVLADGDSRSCEWLSANGTSLAERLGFDGS